MDHLQNVLLWGAVTLGSISPFACVMNGFGNDSNDDANSSDTSDKDTVSQDQHPITPSPAPACPLPSGTVISSDAKYIQGNVAIVLEADAPLLFALYVQRLVKTTEGVWQNTAITTYAENGQTPCQQFVSIKEMWQGFYQDMLEKGIHPAVIKTYIDSIGDANDDPRRSAAGVYAETGLGSCGFAGAPGTIVCGVSANDDFKKYFLPHENTHGFQWHHSRLQDSENNILYRVFAAYANHLYHQSKRDANDLHDVSGKWQVTLMDYALQNEAEWIAEVFKDYLYDGKAHWGYILQHHPELRDFFNCIWRENKSFFACQDAFNVPMVEFAQTMPLLSPPIVSGFSQEQSQAIWNVCFNSNAKADFVAHFDQLITDLNAKSYDKPSERYELGYGDCSHDGVIDWICSYKGPSWTGDNYFWNPDNKDGLHTFIVSGKKDDPYVEYLQDPFLVLPTINGSLAQPMYREWQGSHGSCNGAMYFHQDPDRFPLFVRNIESLADEFKQKTQW